VQEQIRQQAGGPAIAVIVWVNGGELIMCEPRHDRNRKIVGHLLLLKPLEQFSHKGRDIPGLRRHVNDASRCAIANDVLSIPIGRRLSLARHDETMNGLNVSLSQTTFGGNQFVNIVECQVIIPHLLFVAFPVWKNSTLQDYLMNLFRRQSVSLNLS
jgi:hypothetical protein